MEWQGALEDFLTGLRGTHEEKTEQFYRERLRLLTRWAAQEAEAGRGVALADFRARHLRQYLAWRAAALVPLTQRPISDNTRRHDAVACRVFLKFCQREEYIQGNPLQDYQIPNATRAHVPVPTDEEMGRILRACQDRWKPAKNEAARFVDAWHRSFFPKRNYAIVCGLVETCCRINEVLALELADVDAERRLVTIRKAKGDAARVLPVSDAWLSALSDYLRVRPKTVPTPLLFVTEFGTAVADDRFRMQFYKDQDFAGVSPHYTLHSLRHYSLTQVARTDVLAAQKIAGHRSLSVTQGYVHTEAEQMREAHDKAAPLARLLVNTRSAKQGRKRYR